MKKATGILLVICCIFLKAYSANDTLINAKSTWKYRDNGSNLGTNWKNKAYNDAAWVSDTAQFGYGDGDETTIVSYGPDANNKYITTYFRKSFTVSNPAQYDSLKLQLLRDDGARVFLNGTSIARHNLPAGTITYTTLANNNQGTTTENKYFIFNVNKALLVTGTNVIAVEVHQYSVTSDDMGFDLRLIGINSPCEIPAGLVSSNITTASAQLDWTGVSGAAGYNVQYRIAGAGSWTTGSSLTNSLNISSLSAASNYEWQVQTACSTDSSTFSSLSNFTTLAPPCDTASGLSSSNISTSAADLTWNAVNGASSYTIQYRITGSGSWTSASAITNTINISSLSPASNYEWQVQTVCPSSSSSFTSSAYFVTLTPPCNAPSGLVSSGITASSANLSWNAATGAVSYTIQYRIIGSGSWTSASTVTNTLNIISLAPASNYEWQVQTICSASSGTFSSLAFFTTLTPPPCDVPTGILITAVTSSSATVSWTAVPGAVSYMVQYRLTGGTWNQVSAASATVNLAGLSAARTYECKVQTACSSSSGNFSEPVSFTTLQNIITDSLILANGAWKYLDNGTNQGTVWRGSSFNDASWASGPAELGYGDGDEVTVVSYGPNSSSKYITTYFRKTITIPNPSVYTSITLSMVRDDGAVVYINGTEVFRSNMPSGTISYTTLASSGIGGADESAWQNTVLTPSQFVSGSNVIAAEIHQSAGTSSDISFKLRLAGMNTSGAVTTQRGPYLQMLTPNSIHIRWKTDVATNSRVRYGTDMSYGYAIDSSASVTEHEIKITGLNPGTKYYYTIGSSTIDLQGDKNNYFKTSLPTGSTAPFRVWAIGDFGNNSTNQDVVRDAYLNYAGNNPANFSIWLGDNAYATGTEAEFTTNVFAKYPGVFKNTPLYPGLGNHDYANIGYQSASALGTNFPYFNLFTCPANGQAGGIPSGTEKYYSFNYGNAHFIAIDSYGALNNPGSPMYNWLQNDLAANAQRWIVCYFHHPPYSMGTHNSDNSSESVNMRQNIIPLLENYKADLVLCGHSHVYERSVLLNGHYGTESTLTPGMKIDAGSGNAPYYVKSSPNFTGAVYAVCGVSGQGGSTSVQTSWPHAAMYSYANTLYGSMVIDFNADTLSAKFITSTGSINDQFKIVKSGSSRFPISYFFDEEVSGDIIVYPNPFNEALVVRYYLEKESIVSIQVSDLMGRIIYSDKNKDVQSAGVYEVHLKEDCIKSPSGIFVISVRTDSKIMNKKVEKIW